MTYSFLALGDSYTIGEGIAPAQSFPFQTAEFLRQAGFGCVEPRVIARTGWTTGELIAAIAEAEAAGHLTATDAPGGPATAATPFDIVTLLIGVNNQYRGLSRDAYRQEFRQLLNTAIRFAGGRGRPERPAPCFVLSIPDWSVSPFAGANLPDCQGRDRVTVASAIDAFNAIAADETAKAGVEFVWITEHTRLAGAGFAADGLHPSGEEYGYWAEELAGRINRYYSTHRYPAGRYPAP